jgi:hypothetical protein
VEIGLQIFEATIADILCMPSYQKDDFDFFEDGFVNKVLTESNYHSVLILTRAAVKNKSQFFAWTMGFSQRHHTIILQVYK